MRSDAVSRGGCGRIEPSVPFRDRADLSPADARRGFGVRSGSGRRLSGPGMNLSQLPNGKNKREDLKRSSRLFLSSPGGALLCAVCGRGASWFGVPVIPLGAVAGRRNRRCLSVRVDRPPVSKIRIRALVVPLPFRKGGRLPVDAERSFGIRRAEEVILRCRLPRIRYSSGRRRASSQSFSLLSLSSSGQSNHGNSRRPPSEKRV